MKKNEPVFLNHIPAAPDPSIILTRLGYRKTRTVLDEKQKRLVTQGMRLGILLSKPQGVFRRYPLLGNNGQEIRIDEKTVFESRSLSRILTKSEEIFLMASTIGGEITQKISEEVEKGDPAFGMILDAVASETADAGLDFLMSFINKMLMKEGRRLTKNRYSPGYGDLELSNQKVIFELLDLSKLGLSLTKTCILVPEKSVIAVAGVERIESYE